MSTFFRVLLLGVALSGPALAYVDPAAGSILIQGVLAALAGVALFFDKIKAAVYRTFGIKPKEPKKEEQPNPPSGD